MSLKIIIIYIDQVFYQEVQDFLDLLIIPVKELIVEPVKELIVKPVKELIVVPVY